MFYINIPTFYVIKVTKVVWKTFYLETANLQLIYNKEVVIVYWVFDVGNVWLKVFKLFLVNQSITKNKLNWFSLFV